MMTDPIADMLTRIRNAQMARKDEVTLPYSLLKLAVAKVLERENFVAFAEHIENSGTRKRGRFTPDQLRIGLKYSDGGAPAISRIARVSKPGRRVYCSYREMAMVQNGFGVTIVSTPRGVMTNRDARAQKVGGEILCEIW